jgi:FimV-like protein
MGTKLDLAKTYLDMGDSDVRSAHWRRCCREGDDAQRKEVEQLMRRIS